MGVGTPRVGLGRGQGSSEATEAALMRARASPRRVRRDPSPVPQGQMNFKTPELRALAASIMADELADPVAARRKAGKAGPVRATAQVLQATCDAASDATNSPLAPAPPTDPAATRESRRSLVPCGQRGRHARAEAGLGESQQRAVQAALEARGVTEPIAGGREADAAREAGHRSAGDSSLAVWPTLSVARTTVWPTGCPPARRNTKLASLSLTPTDHN